MEKALRLIIHLTRYKFLANSQFKMLWRDQSDKSLYQNLKLLREKNFIGSNNYGYHPKFWRLENIHFLKPKAQKYLLRKYDLKEWDIKLPSNHKWFFDDYAHRKMTITCQIKLYTSLRHHKVIIPLFEHYFEKSKRPGKKYRERATKIHVWASFIIPDSIFIASKNSHSSLFCLELHKWYRVIKIEKQLKQYAYALASGSASIKYNTKKNAHILIVFEKKSTLDTTLERLSQDHFFSNLKPYFLFKCYDDLLVTPLDHRVNLDHKVVGLPTLIDSY